MRRIARLATTVFLCLALLPATLAFGSFPDRVFAPYVDVMLYPAFSIADTSQATGQRYYTLAFVLGGSGCVPKWGGVIGMEDDHYRQEIHAVRAAGGDVIVSFGGANGTELALSCTDVTALQSAYQSVIDRYDLKWVDFDIEGAAVAERASIDRRNKAVRGLQTANPDLKVAYCLPVLPSGLTGDGLYVLENAAQNGVRLDVVNVMAMDYGAWSAPNPEGHMGQYAIDAGNNTHSQLEARGIRAAIGVTPMIGQNDVAAERFYISDAQQLLAWASTHEWVRLLAMWSCGRDNGGCAGQPYASPICSGIAQADFAFIDAFRPFSDGGGGNMPPSVVIVRPTDGATFDAGEDVVVAAEALDPDGVIEQVEFFSNDLALGTDSAAPYEATLADASDGIYEIYAVARDDGGATLSSARIRVLVGLACGSPPWNVSTIYVGGNLVSHAGHEWKAKWWTRGEEPGTTGQWGVWKDQGPCSGDINAGPTVTVISPFGTESFVEGDTITLEAEARDEDGSIARMEFFQGSNSLGTVTTPPYAVQWRNVPAGSYSLTAVATDDQGATGTSAAVSIIVAGAAGACADPAWISTEVYWGGTRLSHDGHTWKAKWWTQGEEPGTTGLWGVWEDLGACR